MKYESEPHNGLTNEDLKDGIIIFGGIAIIIGARGALRGGGREANRQYQELKDSLPEDASRFNRTRTVLSKINYRLIAIEAGKGAIDELKDVLKKPEEKITPVTPLRVNFYNQPFSKAA